MAQTSRMSTQLPSKQPRQFQHFNISFPHTSYTSTNHTKWHHPNKIILNLPPSFSPNKKSHRCKFFALMDLLLGFLELDPCLLRLCGPSASARLSCCSLHLQGAMLPWLRPETWRHGIAPNLPGMAINGPLQVEVGGWENGVMCYYHDFCSF